MASGPRTSPRWEGLTALVKRGEAVDTGDLGILSAYLPRNCRPA